jgi:hypothetical protein
MGVEALALALYRQQYRRSPTVNFGWMPIGYRKSSGNNAQLVAKGLRYRGGPTDAAEASHGPGIQPAGPLTADVQAAGWCRHAWSPWLPIKEGTHAAAGTGLYRIRGANATGLMYVGQGAIAARLQKHLHTAQSGAGQQGQVFAAHQPLFCS